jgi:hypothetical protein
MLDNECLAALQQYFHGEMIQSQFQKTPASKHQWNAAKCTHTFILEAHKHVLQWLQCLPLLCLTMNAWLLCSSTSMVRWYNPRRPQPACFNAMQWSKQCTHSSLRHTSLSSNDFKMLGYSVPLWCLTMNTCLPCNSFSMRRWYSFKRPQVACTNTM